MEYEKGYVYKLMDPVSGPGRAEGISRMNKPPPARYPDDADNQEIPAESETNAKG